jgi:hypothetical protein
MECSTCHPSTANREADRGAWRLTLGDADTFDQHVPSESNEEAVADPWTSPPMQRVFMLTLRLHGSTLRRLKPSGNPARWNRAM